MTELLLDPNVWVAFATLTALEIVLGIDNIVFISILFVFALLLLFVFLVVTVISVTVVATIPINGTVVAPECCEAIAIRATTRILHTDDGSVAVTRGRLFDHCHVTTSFFDAHLNIAATTRNGAAHARLVR